MFVSSLIMGYENEGFFFPLIHLLYELNNNKNNISLKPSNGSVHSPGKAGNFYFINFSIALQFKIECSNTDGI